MGSADSVTHLLTTTYVSVRRKCYSGLQDSLHRYSVYEDSVIKEKGFFLFSLGIEGVLLLFCSLVNWVISQWVCSVFV